MARELCEDKSSSEFYNQIQSYESSPDIFNLTTGMEMIGFPKNLQQHSQHNDSNTPAGVWKGGFFTTSTINTRPPASSSSSKMVNESTSDDFYHHQQQQQQQHDHRDHGHHNDHQTLMVTNDDECSLRCVFPCEGNERPSQGLSLSLSSSNPSSIGLQSFELRQTITNHHHHQMVHDIHHQHQHHHHHHQGGQQFHLRNSKYLESAQELLNEFCSLGSKQINDLGAKQSKNLNKNKQWDDPENSSTSISSRKQSQLYSHDFIELQKRKVKLLSMLEEVDRRYRHYCDQMKAVVSNFEAVAGNGAASVYSALASKAMSRHFRSLRDGIVGQIQAVKKAMGEKDPVALGTTRGETPRLRILDQTLRQQRAFQQISMMENHPWRPQRGLPERSVSVLRAWLFEHFLHPYPSDVDKHILARQTGLSRSQVSNWFINARVRLWKPMVEEMYLEELKEQEDNKLGAAASSDGGINNDQEEEEDDDLQMNQDASNTADQKPTAEQLVRIDSESLSSIISDSRNPKTLQTTQNLQHHQQLNFGSSFGAVELDFAAYNHPAVVGGVSYGNQSNTTAVTNNQNFNSGGVSLTLGLQQHGGSGVNLAFSSPASQSSLFYPRDHIEDCQQVQYSLLDGDQAQNLPYRNLMGAQLLHDLAG